MPFPHLWKGLRLAYGLARAFTLLELSVVLTLIAVIIGGGLVVFTANVQSTQYNTTVARMDAIEKALYNFSLANYRLPCPADLTKTPNSTDYGLEAGADSTSSIGVGTGVCTGTGMVPKANFVYSASSASEGAVPTRALKLPDSFMYDGWGRHFRYAVDASMTSASSMHGTTQGTQCTGSSALIVYDSTGAARTTGAVYVLVSHGTNGYGAYTSNGALVNATNASTNEQTNCHCSGTTAGTYTPKYVAEAIGADGAGFDDIVTFKEYWQMQAPIDTTAACTGSVYVSDLNNHRVQILNTSGTYIGQLACSTGQCNGGSTGGLIQQPRGAVVDASGHVWVSDYANNLIDEYSSGRVFLGQINNLSGNGTLNGPRDIAIDAQQNIWVADSNNNRVQKYSNAGVWLGTLGGTTNGTCQSVASCWCASPSTCSGTSSGNTNGDMHAPFSLAFDSSGNLWVANTGNSAYYIKGYTSAGSFISGSTFSTHEGAAPWGMAFDASGNMWVTASNYVSEYSPSGSTYVWAGVQYGGGGSSESGWGTSSQGQFFGAYGVAFDPSGNMWVIDSGGNRIEIFSGGTVKSQVPSNASCTSPSVCGPSVQNGSFSDPQYIHFGR